MPDPIIVFSKRKVVRYALLVGCSSAKDSDTPESLEMLPTLLSTSLDSITDKYTYWYHHDILNRNLNLWSLSVHVKKIVRAAYFLLQYHLKLVYSAWDWL